MPGRVITVRLPRELLTALNALCRKKRWRAARVLAACLDEHLARPLSPAAIQGPGPLTRRRTFRVSPDLHATLTIFARGGDLGPLIRFLLAGAFTRERLLPGKSRWVP